MCSIRVKFWHEEHRIVVALFLLALSANIGRNNYIITRAAYFVHRHENNVVRSLFTLLYKHRATTEMDFYYMYDMDGLDQENNTENNYAPK